MNLFLMIIGTFVLSGIASIVFLVLYAYADNMSGYKKILARGGLFGFVLTLAFFVFLTKPDGIENFLNFLFGGVLVFVILKILLENLQMYFNKRYREEEARYSALANQLDLINQKLDVYKQEKSID